MSEVLIKVEDVGKKFCRDLKKSLWYGLQDVATELMPGKRNVEQHSVLRSDEFWAVDDISFELRRGECLGLIGRNGAGKTTLLKMLNGLIKPDKGRIEMRGRIGALIALGAGFNPILTGRENIYVNASVLGLSKREIDSKLDEIIDFAEIGEFIDSPVQTYSSGMQVRLGFAVATALKPDILLLDEVLAVGDAAFRVKCFNRMQEIMNDCAVIFVSHSMSQVTRMSNRILLLRDGKLLSEGSELGEIITQYHEQIPASSRSFKEGTCKTEIMSVEIIDKFDNITNVINYGDSYIFVVTFKISAEINRDRLKILITISDQEETNVAQIMELIKLESDGNKIIAKLAFDSMQLNAGRYWITSSILLGERGELSCVRRKAASIIVTNSYVGYAPVILKCESIQILQPK